MKKPLNNLTTNTNLDQRRDANQQLQPGTTLAKRYLIEGILGVGGMGSVYRVRDLHFPNVVKLVAVKEMINRALDPMVQESIVRNFEREANILASLDHRGIPRIYDYFSINERSYLVEEYISGKDLERIINSTNGFIPVERVVRWGIELCEVLEILHNHKPEVIIFRDMKPSNVMINQHDHIVLVDFGIAKPFQAGEKGTMIGTEGYSPPEQYRGEATPLVDIYALGATLHHLLTRKDPRLEPPFSFKERPIQQINPEIPSELETVINTALAYNKKDRYQSASEMKEALIKMGKNTGLLAKTETPTSGFTRAGSIKPIWEFECEDEIRGTPTLSNETIYIGCYDHNLYALKSDQGEFIWKYPTEAGVVSKPTIYEDNIIFGSEDFLLYAVHERSGRTNWTYETNGPIRSSPYLAEGHIFIGSDDTYLHVVNALTGRKAWKTATGAPIRSTPLVSDDLVYFGNESGEFFCLDYSGSVKWRYKAKRAVTSSPRISDGIVYFGSVDSTFYALDAKTGWVIWRLRLGKPTISTPTIADHFLFTGAIDGAVYCLDASTSREVWKFSTQHQVSGSPIVHKDSLYFGSVDGFFYCLEYRSGRLKWKFQTRGPITGTPVAHDDMIYIGSTDHYIYALMA